MRRLIIYVKDEDTVSKKALGDIYVKHHAQIWNTLPSDLMSGSKTSFDKTHTIYTALLPDGGKIIMCLMRRDSSMGKLASLDVNFVISEEKAAQLDFEQIADRIMDVYRAYIHAYPSSVLINAMLEVIPPETNQTAKQNSPEPAAQKTAAEKPSGPKKTLEQRLAELEEDKRTIARLEKQKETGPWNSELEELLQDIKRLTMRKELLIKHGAR